MSLKKFILGGTAYEILPLEDKFIISAKRYLGFMWLFQSRRLFLGKDDTLGTKNELAALLSNFAFSSEREAQDFMDQAENTYQAIKAL